MFEVGSFSLDTLYTITLFTLFFPDLLSPVGELLSVDGVVHRITYSFSYFLFLLIDYLLIYS